MATFPTSPEQGAALTADEQAAVDAVDTSPPWAALAAFAAIIGAEASIVVGVVETPNWQEPMNVDTTVAVTAPAAVETPSWSA